MTATHTTATHRAAARSGRRTRLGDGLSPLRAVPMLPAALLLLGFMLGPILYSLYLAFTDSAIRGEGASDTSFVGLSNFTDAFTDADFWNSVILTLMGSLYVESLYSIPGMGGLLVTVIQRQDNTVVQALVLFYAAISILGLLVGDILMALVDPRITFGKKGGAR